MRSFSLGIAAALLFLSSAVSADEVTGRARVIDGDTLAIGNHRIRLFGIDAPESKQMCELNRKAWDCGQAAQRALAKEIGDEAVTCKPMDIDRYKRIVAVCMVHERDLNEFMVREGWALAYRSYSKVYVSAEADAAREKLGIWRGKFEKPWDWRRRTK